MIDREQNEARNLRFALELYQAGEDLKRQSLRRTHPGATDDEIETMIVDWLRERPGARYGDCPGRRLSLEELGLR